MSEGPLNKHSAYVDSIEHLICKSSHKSRVMERQNTEKKDLNKIVMLKLCVYTQTQQDILSFLPALLLNF